MRRSGWRQGRVWLILMLDLFPATSSIRRRHIPRSASGLLLVRTNDLIHMRPRLVLTHWTERASSLVVVEVSTAGREGASLIHVGRLRPLLALRMIVATASLNGSIPEAVCRDSRKRRPRAVRGRPTAIHMWAIRCNRRFWRQGDNLSCGSLLLSRSSVVIVSRTPPSTRVALRGSKR